MSLFMFLTFLDLLLVAHILDELVGCQLCSELGCMQINKILFMFLLLYLWLFGPLFAQKWISIGRGTSEFLFSFF